MPSTPPTPRRHRELLSGALAVVLAAGIAIIALAVRRITKDEDGDAALRSPRHAAVVFGCAVVLVLLVVPTSLRQDRTVTQTGATSSHV